MSIWGYIYLLIVITCCSVPHMEELANRFDLSSLGIHDCTRSRSSLTEIYDPIFGDLSPILVEFWLVTSLLAVNTLGARVLLSKHSGANC